MIFIQHRCNKKAEIELLPAEMGTEIDLRSSVDFKDKIHLSHDPWSEGEDFESWLKIWSAKKNRGPLILNTKEDGLEEVTQKLLESYGVENYFFLDTTVPTLKKWMGRSKKFAIRYSSLEPIELALKFKGQFEWLWVDCFDQIPVDRNIVETLRGDFKICLVSPELQGGSVEKIETFKKHFAGAFDAVCTKKPDLWK